MEKVTVWRWRRDRTKIIVGGDDIFAGSATFAFEWEPARTIEALNGLKRPIPPGYHLYLFERAQQFPYNTARAQKVERLLYPIGSGFYSVMKDADVNGLRAYDISIII